MIQPSNNYIVCQRIGGQSILWPQAKNYINYISQLLNNNQASNVALCYDDTFEFFCGWLACLNANKTPILLPNNLPGTLSQLESEYDIILSNDIMSAQSINVSYDDFLTLNFTNDDELVDIDNNKEMIFFTSGSTGFPKKIVKPVLNLIAELNDFTTLFKEKIKGLTIAASVSHQHLYGFLFKVLWPYLLKIPFYNKAIAFPEQLPENLTLAFISSPALLTRLEELSLEKVNCQLVFSSGGPLSFHGAKRTQEVFKTLPFEIFGSTETGGIAIRQQKSNNQPWTPLPGVLVKQNQQQRILLKSNYVDANNWSLGDDLIELNDQGQFLLKGRVDRIVKLEEKRISLTLIESLISTYLEKNYDDILIKVVDFSINERKYLGVIVQSEHIKNLNKPQLNEIKALLLNHIERIAIPKRWRFTKQIPVNSQGKVEYATLRDWLALETIKC